MSAPSIQMSPDYNGFTIQELDILLMALETRLKAKECMSPKEAAKYCGISVSSLYKSSLPFHRIPGLGGRVYLRSELVETIRKS